MNTKEILISIIVIPLFFSAIYGQEERKQSDPIELPAFIIEGVERLSIRSGIKQTPGKTSPITKEELDSLNTLEKYPPQMIPLDALPESIPARIKSNGYLSADFGRYSTALLDAGYSFDIEDYRFYAAANFDFSNGHIVNANYFKTDIDLTADYIAPKKYWIFGGSRTRTNLNFNQQDYNLYARTDAPERTLFGLDLNIDVEGKYENYLYDLGGTLGTLRFTKSPAELGEDIFSGYIKIKNYWKGFLIGANLDIDLRNIRASSANFFQVTALGSYSIPELTISVNAGLQAASSTTDISRGGLLIDGNIEYRLDKSFTLHGYAATGLEKQNLANFAYRNPYINDTPIIDFPYDILKLGGKVAYHPLVSVGLSAGVKLRILDRLPYFESFDTATFRINYESAKILELNLESFLDITEKDRLIGNLIISNAAFSDTSTNVPYIPNIKIDAQYNRDWSETFGTFIGIAYIANRFADYDNARTIDGFANIYGSAYYKFSHNFTIKGSFDNLINSNVYIWERYKERDLFFSLALMWHF